ncbi:pyridoxal-phosphate dependent enzyme [Micromonospora echinofusca]|uniref:pyridoxal-phosphate dependent enzyme n=2 Tax=Micromonospora echinofusca TaxID=47858 RepID=UPI003446C361
MIFQNVVDAIGHTPLIRLRMDVDPRVQVYAKLELQNLFAMKDRVARHVILEARRLGVLRPGAPIVESSSGTMALGVALVGTALGHPVHVVTDPRIDPVTLAKLRALGCQVHVVDRMSSQGWQGARLERLHELLEGLPGAFFPEQYRNPDNPGAYRSLAGELLGDLASFDVLVGAVGTGGSLCGSARALRRALPELRVVGVDCVGSVLFGQPDVPNRLQGGLGNSLEPANLDRRQIDEVHWLNDREAFGATRDLAREQQIFGGNTSGSVYQVLKDVARRAEPGTRIVGIFPDRGDRYAQTVYDDGWAADRLQEMDAADRPRPINPGEVAVSWSRTHDVPRTNDERYLLFLEANTSGTGVLALGVARQMGLRPVLLTDRPDRYPGLADTDCEVLVCETHDLPGLRSLIQGRFRREQLAGVTTTSDFYTVLAAELADWLGLPGNPPAAVAACRNKALLREALRDSGIRQPRFVAVTDPARAAAAVSEVGLPCVVKPADDSSSNAVLLCATVEEATAHVETVLGMRFNVRGMPTARCALVEEYVRGAEFSVEVFGESTGNRCLGITEKRVTGGPHFVELGHVFPADLPADQAIDMVDAVLRALATVGMSHGATHTEVRLTPSGPAIIEINPRPAGGMIPELYRLATGSNLLAAQLAAAVGEPTRLSSTTHGYAGIEFLVAARPGTLRGTAGGAEIARLDGVEQVTVTASPGTSVRPPRNAYDRLGYVIATGSSRAEVIHRIHTAVDQVRLLVDEDSPVAVSDEASLAPAH